jgi:ABC-type multidrug transport system fused ATPase/permease subunit
MPAFACCVVTVLLLGSYLVGHGFMTAASLTTFYFYSTTVQDAMQVCITIIL